MKLFIRQNKIDVLKQLQTYKNREDRLRKLITDNNMFHMNGKTDVDWINELLQILNGRND